VNPANLPAADVVPLSADDKQALRAHLMTRTRLVKDIAMMPLALFAFTALSAIPAGFVALLIAGLEALFDMPLLMHKVTQVLLAGLWLGVAMVANYFVFRGTVAEYRLRFADNAPLRRDLAGSVKHCETLQIEEALCVQENEHSGLGYFCRLADGRVIFMFDYASPSWEDDDLATGYRRGIDPRQERFVPTHTLRVCRAPASGRVFDEEFSGEPVPLVEGIYWTDVTKLPDSGTFIGKSWKAVLARYKRDKKRVNWDEVIKRAEKTSGTV
jgi:hypothetical protein